MTHALIVSHRGAHISQRFAHAIVQRLGALHRKTRQMDLNERVPALAVGGRRKRVKHGERRDVLVSQFAHHRVDQERHVRAGDFENVAIKFAAAFTDAAADACALILTRTLAAPDPEIVRERSEVGSREIDHLVGRCVVIHAAQESFGGCVYGAVSAKGRPRALGHVANEFFSGVREFLARSGVHASVSLFCAEPTRPSGRCNRENAQETELATCASG